MIHAILWFLGFVLKWAAILVPIYMVIGMVLFKLYILCVGVTLDTDYRDPRDQFRIRNPIQLAGWKEFDKDNSVWFLCAWIVWGWPLIGFLCVVAALSWLTLHGVGWLMYQLYAKPISVAHVTSRLEQSPRR